MEVFYPVIIALIFNAFDVVSGLVAAFKCKDIKSSKLRDGLFKKVGFIFCYMLAYVMDNYGAIIGIKLSVNILPIIVLYVVTTEIVSIIENICKINPDLLPEKLKELFHVNNQ